MRGQRKHLTAYSTLIKVASVPAARDRRFRRIFRPAGRHEYQADLVGNLYLELLNRTVDTPSGAHWAAKLDGGAADGQVLGAIAASDEFFNDTAASYTSRGPQ